MKSLYLRLLILLQTKIFVLFLTVIIVGCTSSNAVRPSFDYSDNNGRYDNGRRKENHKSTNYEKPHNTNDVKNKSSATKKNASKQSSTVSYNQKNDSSKKKSSNPTKNVVNKAYKYIGVRYRFGGTTTSGFDCSGLVWRIYHDMGYDLTRTNVSHYIKMGKRVSAKEIKPGDLVFFRIKGKISHMGIVSSKDSFIHASSSRGVIESSLSDSYWKNKIVQFRRLY